MLPMRFTVQEAIDFSHSGCVEEWIHIFLKTVGNNIPMSDGLKMEPRNWVGPVLFPTNKLYRCCGPETGMEYRVDKSHWENKVGEFCDLIRTGWDYAPLIAEHVEDKFIVRDGNHRFEAMKRLNQEKCWVIYWGCSETSPRND